MTPVTDPKPTLEYGRAIPAGKVAILDRPDGSVEVVIPRRPWWQTALAAGSVSSVLLVVFGATGLLRQPVVWTVAPIMLCCVGIVFWTVLMRWGREQFRIRAGRESLLVWYVEAGDDVLLDVPRAEVVDVRAPGAFSHDKNHLVIETTRGTRYVMICRGRAELDRIAQAVKRGLGLQEARAGAV